ncbi:Transcription-associated protein 1 [Rhizoctonia solani]|uniref:Transcription-associated protein 1 n=1 Tax=Rhizoctonia solani TaxID=456999 RepID=A0A0K6G358_9AGAM|nr:Transcription-associated protein 1 [Rhizoctonia solani]
MNARYSNLPYMTSELISVRLTDNETLPNKWDSERAAVDQKHSFMAWASAAWVMIAHFTLSIGITIFVLVYVEGHHFNLTERYPVVRVLGGTRIAPFAPMQSDIVTLLSSMIAVLKCALAAWAASLCWNIALFLMERRGLAHQDLQALLRYGLLTPGAYSMDWSTWLIGFLLLAGTVANLSSPVLTGSIAWVPSNRLVHGLTNDPAQIYAVEDGSLTELSSYYLQSGSIRDSAAFNIAGNIGWGRETEKGVLKRSLSTVDGLATNSTLENVTLPYFQVHSIRWIENREDIPFVRDGADPGSLMRRALDSSPSTISGFLIGDAVLIPNVTANWSSDPLESTTIHDTRLLVFYYAYDSNDEIISITWGLPSRAYKLHSNISYSAYAWITFSAGVGQCREYNCILSSPQTVRNNTPIELEPHQLTFQALSMAFAVGINLSTQNNSLPSSWDNVDDYVEAVLVRSYAGAWVILNGLLQPSILNTSYVPSVPSLLASVDQKRVHIWLGTQLVVTVLSGIFLIIQSRLSKYPLVSDTSLTAFHLDTTAIPLDSSASSVYGIKMEKGYSSLPYTSPNLIPNASPKNEVAAAINPGTDDTSIARRNPLVAWASILWAPVLHFILSMGVALLTLTYVDGRHFNLTERSPDVNTTDGPLVTPFLLTQSDTVTIISSIIAVLKYALTAWAASLCWNVALFLMERRGLARRDFEALVHSGLLAPGAYSKSWSTPLIAILLLANLAANLSSPILTGSITWVPSNRLVQGLSIRPSQFEDAVDGTLSQLVSTYYDNYFIREGYVMRGVGLASLGWERDSDKGVVKRVSTTIGGLSVNSTIENITLPYFQVHSIRWIENQDDILVINGNKTMAQVLYNQFEMAPSTVSGFPPGYAILVPNVTANWSSDPLESRVIHDTRLLILYYAYNSVSMTRDLPSGAYTLLSNNHKYAFAWVTFSAGVGRCNEYNCVLSTPTAIRNNTPIEVEPHQLTFQALSMAPVIGVYLVNQNTSVPYMWDSLNEYVEGVLVRSYTGAWCNLNAGMWTSTTSSRYVPSVPSLLAFVDHKRVYAWLGIQLLVTLLSVPFLLIQSCLSRYPFASDPALTAFYLDTTAIPRGQADSSIYETRKIEQQGDQFKVRIEPGASPEVIARGGHQHDKGFVEIADLPPPAREKHSIIFEDSG